MNSSFFNKKTRTCSCSTNNTSAVLIESHAMCLPYVTFGIYDYWKELETSVDVMYLLGWSDSTQKMLTWLHIITASLHHLDLSISGLLFVSDWKCTLFLSPLLCSIIIPLSPTFFAYKIMFCHTFDSTDQKFKSK